MDFQTRQATNQDKQGISRAIAYSFEKDFSALIKDMERVAKSLADGIDAKRFFVAVQDGEITGVIACADCTGRAVAVSLKNCMKYLGLFRGLLGYLIFKSEFMCSLTYPSTNGYIEFVGVLKRARGKGLAKAMLKEIIAQRPQYGEFILDVTDVNLPAQRSYLAFGFEEFDRVAEKHPKQKGFNSKIYMKYTLPH